LNLDKRKIFCQQQLIIGEKKREQKQWTTIPQWTNFSPQQTNRNSQTLQSFRETGNRQDQERVKSIKPQKIEDHTVYPPSLMDAVQ
jgi:hypothetical protein